MVSEIIFFVHDVGHAFMRDIEEVDVRLNLTCLKQIGAHVLQGVYFRLLGLLVRCHHVDRAFRFLHTILESCLTVRLGRLLSEAQQAAGRLDRLLDWL